MTTAESEPGRSRTGRIVLVAVGSILALIALAVLAGGGAALWADKTQRDSAGYFTSSPHAFAAGSYALTHQGVDLNDLPSWMDRGNLARVRVRAASAEGHPLFVGIARERNVKAYLTGVAHAEVADVDLDPFNARYDRVAGTSAPPPPASQDFWAASATGTHPRLAWPVRKGTWSVVVMNLDGSRGVAADVDFGAKISHLGWIIGGIFALGIVLIAIAVFLLVLGVRGLRGPGTPATVASGVSAPAVSGSYPAALSARLDEPLSRWLWLVKWILLIPHYVVLAFLWIAVVVLTVGAWFAILFTGRYPRGIFDFNVGVLAWTWRVHYYGYNALGTDRYPPFALEDVRDYPARLGIEYPERLSRGLIFVKWLLALPHLIIVSVLAGGGVWGASHVYGSWHAGWGGLGLIGLLTLFAGVALLFTARYPRGLFDLIIGFNRWALRTFAYVALMTDEYPPFRLDSDGDEPPAVVEPAVATGV